mmetsp:Transcript_40717/g.75786  ORF Transcript_40717/g.75786 Transcript_40717/m.75786 type:complete len:189 (+) Transcript_40717:94-660(+)
MSSARSLPDFQGPRPFEDAPAPLQLILTQRAVLIVASMQGLVALCRFALGDLWGGLMDLLVQVTGMICFFEMKALYGLIYAFASLLDCFLSAGLFLTLLISAAGHGSRIDLQGAALLASASMAMLGATAGSVLWWGLRVGGNDGMFSGAAQDALMYGSMKDDTSGRAVCDPFLLEDPAGSTKRKPLSA